MEIIYGIFSESFWWVAPILMTLTVAISGVINGWLKLEGFVEQSLERGWLLCNDSISLNSGCPLRGCRPIQ